MKEKITEQSIRLFDKKGFSETSIQDIVDSIGVTKGTFYYYFSSKEELLMDIHLRYIDDLLSQQEKILKNSNADCKGKLYDVVAMLIGSIENQGASAKVFFREIRNLSEERLGQIIPKRDRFRTNIEALIAEGIRNGEFREDLNASIITFGILGAANWSYQWFSPNGSVPDYEVARIFTDMVLNGITN
ncbi:MULTISPECIES: TetR/AcrR family transcriptional regulator [Bacillus]|uniref:TetR/AcrR family transcriptional regulator n=1 Tax=Bacillus TaxID=1386 RepID=UPI000C773FD2|nr:MULTISPECIES: TetR/AcrR family transcriptional regulator [Bacillus]MCA1034338.1 TetR/AcrR family transcriptional regulator [Bacillus infantis]MDT0159746.1 TetR/AcrR family transcriptional regulator [Bacillus sp. AG4(2022)]PLR71667.1 TetR family transcriptional regulator [Bacillus sp. UMB0728]